MASALLVLAPTAGEAAEKSTAATAAKKGATDHSGKKRRGKASYYSKHFAGKKRADGGILDPNANVAASKTLPIGTRARVKNLENGRSTEVEIRDRGPYAKDRAIDLSPRAAEQLKMKKEGVAPVEIAPVTVPQPDGSVKPGAGAGR